MKRIAERVLPGAVAAALAVTGWACADRSRPGPGEAIEILVWDFGGVPGHRQWIRQAVRDFNAARDDIRLELERRTGRHNARESDQYYSYRGRAGRHPRASQILGRIR